MRTIFGREPVLVLALANALIACAVGFGLDLTDVQRVAVDGLVLAVLGFVARGRVTPDA